MGGKDGCKGRLEAATVSTFCIYLVREILFLSGKNQGILKTDVCGNHVKAIPIFRQTYLIFSPHLQIKISNFLYPISDFNPEIIFIHIQPDSRFGLTSHCTLKTKKFLSMKLCYKLNISKITAL